MTEDEKLKEITQRLALATSKPEVIRRSLVLLSYLQENLVTDKDDERIKIPLMMLKSF